MKKQKGSIFVDGRTNRLVGQIKVNGVTKRITQRKNEENREFKQRFQDLIDSIDFNFKPEGQDTLYSLIDQFIRQKNTDGYTTARSYARNLETLKQLEKCCDFMHKKVLGITTNDIVKAKENMRQYAQSSISKMWSMLKVGFNIAYHRHFIQYDLMNDVTLKMPISTKANRIVGALTINERQKLRSVLENEEKDHPYSLIIQLQLETGMRIGEVLARSFKDINFEKGTIKIWNTLTEDENYNVVWSDHTKTYNAAAKIDKGAREIPLSASMLSKLSNLLKTNSRAKLTNIYGCIFYDYSNNTFITPKEINAWLKRINSKYKITSQSLTTHIMRHTRITELTEQHLHPIVIHYMVGHTDKSTVTENVYTDVSLDFVKQELTKMG